ncbi:cytochrome c-type biogenesis protein CcmF [Pseudarcicella hirudinis]|uniref:Cytochrome c-type biogenesis protein CcmF n=1 Tax=Pseudarcicella hirudinis TaxID=1079859 RepID=A0A1I5XMM6_9BACT|nr:cytochrome c biogenesis protein CcsA [Pseudarcicella hirudinis]SFQ33160.1 cytochrome c-type biogenesis protein CcmF [Pseudarcicella hirudinis]
MIHSNIGNIGHLLLIISFVTSLVATFGYFKATQSKDLAIAADWRKFSRWAFYIHAAAVVGVASSLFVIIYNHYFEYHYAYSHSSLALPLQYMISCYWEGQEGSFLLWIFWQAVLGIVLINTNKTWEAPLMTIFSLVQAFLCSMILGVVLPLLDFKIGSSPFLLLREAQPDLPVWKIKPDFIPVDGRGLNPLLQNYWMVIHPPTLFLGFATTLIPFAYLMAGLWKKQYREWIRPALPWALFSGGILGVGILMGAYWAYETLNFGGYWNWDPVENASLVPWLVLVAAIHTMIAYKSSQTALKASIILVIATFILVLYSTFLNRSGVLGNASVHSFTDLGLSGQLLIYIFTFLIIAVALSIFRWKEIPSDEKETSAYSKEFWIFMGATVLCLSSFQIIFTTSIPVYNKVAEVFGFVSNIALPADQVAHYTKFQVWAFVLVAMLSGFGQYFWWGRFKKETIAKAIVSPLLIALVLTALVVNFAKVYNITYAIVLFAGFFALVTNGSILTSIVKGNYKLSGGAVTHIGMALMLMGIMFSSGYSKVVSLNNSGFAISNKEEAFTKDDNKENKENLPLWIGQPAKMKDYMLTYKGRRLEVRGVKGYFDRKDFDIIEGDFHAIALKNVERDGKKLFSKGDTVTVEPENVYYEIEFRQPDGKVFSLYPRWQINPKMGTAISPDLTHSFKSDIYSYVSLDPKLATQTGDEKEWSKTENFVAAVGDTLFLNDYVAILSKVERVLEGVEGVQLGENDAAVKAHFKVIGKEFQSYEITPIFIIKDGMIATPSVESEETGLRIRFTNIDPKTGKFGFGVNTTQRDLIILKALEKPYINVLWIGSIVLAIGFAMATARRAREFRLMRDKGLS